MAGFDAEVPAHWLMGNHYHFVLYTRQPESRVSRLVARAEQDMRRPGKLPSKRVEAKGKARPCDSRRPIPALPGSIPA